MNPVPSSIIKKIWIALVALILLAAGYWGYRLGIGPQAFRGDVVGVIGIAGENLDPLLSGRACFASGESTLRVEPVPGRTFDWSVTPPANVISTPGGAPTSSLSAIGNEIRFSAPAEDDPNAATLYTVDVVLHGDLPGTGGGSFTVNISAPCVTALDFVTPSGTVFPVDGKVVLQSVRATMSSGETVIYDAAQIPQLDLEFEANPAGQIQFVGNEILVPFEHPETQITMTARGKAVAPVVFGRNHAVPRDGVTRFFSLESDEVDPNSVTVWEDADADGEPDTLLEEGVAYTFHDEGHDADASTNDSVEFILPSPPAVVPAELYVAYWYHSSDTEVVSSPLTIAPIQCELLNANIYQGLGQGFYFPEVGDTPSAGSESEPFDFDATDLITSILVSNPVGVGTTFGTNEFELRFDFVAGLAQRAVLANHSGNHYEIDVLDQGTPAQTASNFAYTVNTILGDSSPFIAYIDAADNNQVILNSVEVGAHTNDYGCSVNGTAFPVGATCFTGGSTGTRGGVDIVEVNPPRPLEPTMNQGETRVVYSRGGVSNLDWRTSDASILSVEPLSEATTTEELLGNDNVILNAGALDASDFDLPMAGAPIASTSTSACAYEEPEGGGVAELTTCNVALNMPVTFNPEPAGYSITITPPTGNPIPGTVQGSSANAILTGSTVIDSRTGGALQLTGQLTVPVGGDAIGSLQAAVTIFVNIADFNNPAEINSKWSIASVTGTLSKVSLIPTDRTPNQGGPTVTNFAVLTAKRPGRASLFVTDSLGCTAPLDIEVLGQKLFIDFENPAQNEFIEQGDSIQLRAWLGFRGAVDANNDVTNQAEWESDNTSVVTVSSTGRVTAVAPGVANVFARYNTTIPETGTVTSEGSLRVHVDEIHGLTISLNRASLDLLPTEERNAAYQHVAILIHDPSAAGSSLTVEGTVVPMTLPVPAIPYASELDQIRGISNALRTALAAIAGIRVTAHPNLPGVLLLEAIVGNANNMVDISTNATSDKLAILPSLTSDINLPAAETYTLVVAADYDSGRTRLLTPTSVEWVATPVNILDDTSLVTGLLKRETDGGTGGTATVVAKFTNPDTTVIQSNALHVSIAEGPVVEFVRRVGSGAIEKGSQISLLMRVSDIDTIADLQDITVSLVRSTATTYAGINSDADAVWFTATTFLEQAAVAPPAEDTPPPPAAAQYKDFTLPIEIPVDANLFDGTYRLVISISDQAGHTTNFVLPNFRIGPVAAGDVNGDGQLNMIDVILAFRIANGTLTPTAAQQQAANLDGLGNVTMIDVILLFMQVNSGTT